MKWPARLARRSTSLSSASLASPGYEELAMGAVATGGVRVLNDQIVQRLRIPDYVIDAVAAREQQELARRERLTAAVVRLPMCVVGL